jgi:hypothetical protein
VVALQGLKRITKMVRGIKFAPRRKLNIIKIMNKLTGLKNNFRSKPVFYVVTRDGRRVWHKDYWTIPEAQKHVDSLASSLRKFNDPGYKRIIIVETRDPEEID